MRIFQVDADKKRYLELLLLADEQEDMIDRYLEEGTLFVLEDNGTKVVCVVTDEGDGILEIKNLATDPAFHGKGYGRALIDCVAKTYAERFHTLQVGTGDSPATVPFYEKCGFVRSHVLKNFFIDHYDHIIIDGGVQLVDMVYLRKNI